MFDKIFRIAFTLTPFILIFLMLQKMYLERGFNGVLIVTKSLIFMAIGVGLLGLIAYSAYKNSKSTTRE
jgi:hypothetical protein